VLLRFHAQDREPTYHCVEADERRNDKIHTAEVCFNLEILCARNSKVVSDRYVFNPEQSTGRTPTAHRVAAFRLATGKLSEMRNKDIKVLHLPLH